MTVVLSEGLAPAAAPGAAAFALRDVLGLATAFLPSVVLRVGVFRFTGTTLSGSWNNNGYPG